MPTLQPQPPFDGACLCGAVRIRATALPLLTLACHCADCQKLCASAYSLATLFPSDSFSCTGPLLRGGLRSPGRTHFHCRSCLSLIYSRVVGADWRINLRTPVLSDAASFEPFVEFMTEAKLPWVQLSAPRSFARFPASAEEVQALMDDFSRR